MPGWRDEKDTEDIDGFVQHTVNNEGRREYEISYDRAKDLQRTGKTSDEIRQVIIREPEKPKPNMHGVVPMNFRKKYAADRRLTDIRTRAVEDALQGKPSSYKD